MATEFLYLGLVLISALILVENRLQRVLQLTALHGFCLACLLVAQGMSGNTRPFYLPFLVVMVVVFKAILTPLVFRYAARSLSEPEATHPRLGFMGAVALLFVVYAGVFVTVESIELVASTIVICTGMLIFVVRTHWIPLMLGFVIFENGILALTVALHTHLPIGIELGTFVDALLAIVAATTIQLWHARAEPEEEKRV